MTENTTKSGGSSEGFELPPGHAAVCKAVNESSLLASLLYDLNLLPEQTQHDPVRWFYTMSVVEHMRKANDDIARLKGLLQEALEISDNWPGIAYTHDLIERCKAAMPGWSLTYG